MNSPLAEDSSPSRSRSPRSRAGERLTAWGISVTGAIAASTSLPLFGIEGAAVEEAVTRIRRQEMQWELPEGRSNDTSDLPDLPLIDFLQLFLWGLLVAVVVASVLFIAGSIRQRRRGDDEDGTLELEGSVELSERPLANAEQAAARGDYAEAIHLLLLGTIEEIRTSIGYDAPRWLTSREIARAAPLPADALPPLEALIGTVERSYFGEIPVEISDYQSCVDWHRQLREACAGGRRR